MEVFEAIKTRRSVRAYSTKSIEPISHERLLAALRYAPSACNFQPWRFILVEDQQLREKLAEASNRQMWMAQAPLIIVACGFAEMAYKSMGGYGNSVEVDIAIALDHLTLIAVAEGLGTCWIGAFDEQNVKDLLNVPKKVKVIALIPVGYPESANLNHPVNEIKRKSPEEVFCTDYYK